MPSDRFLKPPSPLDLLLRPGLLRGMGRLPSPELPLSSPGLRSSLAAFRDPRRTFGGLLGGVSCLRCCNSLALRVWAHNLLKKGAVQVYFFLYSQHQQETPTQQPVPGGGKTRVSYTSCPYGVTILPELLFHGMT